MKLLRHALVSCVLLSLSLLLPATAQAEAYGLYAPYTQTDGPSLSASTEPAIYTLALHALPDIDKVQNEMIFFIA